MQLLIRLAFRITSLGLKFALTVVIARTLGFAAVADYGLAVAVSVVSSKLLGLGFSTEMNRRLSGSDVGAALHDARRLLGLYGVVYVAIAALAGVLFWKTDVAVLRAIPPGVMLGVMLVAFSEHIGLETTSYVFSLHRPRLGSMLLFVRTGFWAALAIAGLMTGALRSIETIFTLWWASNALVTIVACWCIWSGKAAQPQPGPTFDRSVGAIQSIWTAGLPFFIATTVLSSLQYSERFIASGVLTADQLGRYVFSWSISNSIQTIAYATVVVTAAPRLVRALNAAKDDFWKELAASVRLSVGVSTLAGFAIILVSKPIFSMAHEPLDGPMFLTLFTLLISFLLRSIGDILWSGAIALRIGKQIVAAISGVALMCIPLQWLLIKEIGTTGAAFSHLMTSFAIFALLMLLLLRRKKEMSGTRSPKLEVVSD